MRGRDSLTSADQGDTGAYNDQVCAPRLGSLERHQPLRSAAVRADRTTGPHRYVTFGYLLAVWSYRSAQASPRTSSRRRVHGQTVSGRAFPRSCTLLGLRPAPQRNERRPGASRPGQRAPLGRGPQPASRCARPGRAEIFSLTAGPGTGWVSAGRRVGRMVLCALARGENILPARVGR
jgi:hypothetical protein